MKYSENEIVEIIKESGLKLTPHRIAILLRISKAKTPIAVQKIIDDLKKKDGIDQATVYRNLTALEEADLIRRFDFNHGHAHYELYSESSYHKMICRTCENIEKISASYFDLALKKLVKKSKKFKTSETASVDIYGLCKSCA